MKDCPSALAFRLYAPFLLCTLLSKQRTAHSTRLDWKIDPSVLDLYRVPFQFRTDKDPECECTRTFNPEDRSLSLKPHPFPAQASRMGLGKTLESLMLVLSNPAPEGWAAESSHPHLQPPSPLPRGVVANTEGSSQQQQNKRHAAGDDNSVKLKGNKKG
eukprot:scaffold227849_cov18-Tisochrysis_lutea.AAC.1